jgi:hypothetical protein
MPEVELCIAGKSVTLKADEIDVKSLGKLAVKLWQQIDLPPKTQPYGRSAPSDSQADDSLRWDQPDDNGRIEVVR